MKKVLSTLAVLLITSMSSSPTFAQEPVAQPTATQNLMKEMLATQQMLRAQFKKMGGIVKTMSPEEKEALVNNLENAMLIQGIAQSAADLDDKIEALIILNTSI